MLKNVLSPFLWFTVYIAEELHLQWNTSTPKHSWDNSPSSLPNNSRCL